MCILLKTIFISTVETLFQFRQSVKIPFYNSQASSGPTSSAKPQDTCMTVWADFCPVYAGQSASRFFVLLSWNGSSTMKKIRALLLPIHNFAHLQRKPGRKQKTLIGTSIGIHTENESFLKERNTWERFFYDKKGKQRVLQHMIIGLYSLPMQGIYRKFLLR